MPSHNHEHNSANNIKVAFFLNLVFTIVEIVGGLYTNSMAIMADAVHDLGDSFSLGLSWFLEKVAQKEQSTSFSYGYKRFSLLAALINAIILIAGSFIILAETIPRIIHPETTNTKGMIVMSIFGIIVNFISSMRIRKGKTINEKVISWHLMEDLLGWVAILIASIIMTVSNIKILDPIISIIITFYIFWNVSKNLKTTIVVFLQGVPPSLSIERINTIISHIPNTIEAHDTHIWSLDGKNHIVTTHILVNTDCSYETMKDIKCIAKAMLQKFGIQHATIEMEREHDSCGIKSEISEKIISKITKK